jgi:hypothetical protein
MMRARTITISLATLLSIASPALGQISSNAGTSGFQFLKIGVGAHETALAGAGTATVSGPEAVFWNVAGITKDEQRSALFFYNSWFASIKQDFLAVSLPLGDNNFAGFSANIVALGQMDETTVDQPQGTGRSFTAGDLALSASYARRITDWVSAGITAKYVNEQIWDLVSDGWAFDLGLAYDNDRLHLGMVIKDFGANKQISGAQLQSLQQLYPDWQTSTVQVGLVPRPVSLPTSFSAGAGYDFLKNEFHRATVLGNLAYFNDNGETYNLAGEYTYLNLYSAMMGYRFHTDIYGLTVGASVHASVGGSVVGFSFAAVQMKDFGYREQFQITLSL